MMTTPSTTSTPNQSSDAPRSVESEWSTDRLDLGRYLAHLGYAEQPKPTAQALRTLHRAHLAAIPFENLDIVLGRGIRLDMESLQDKLLRGGRGGYCYEHNLLFAAALERLGYPVNRLVGRVRPDGSAPRTHMLLRAEADGSSWLADVGFGGGVLEPIPLVAGTTSQQGGWTYRLDGDENGTWLLSTIRPEGPEKQYTFTLEPQRAADYELINYYTSTHPGSPFTGKPVVMRAEDQAHHVLTGRELTTRHPDGTVKERELDETGMATVLSDTFRITLSADELARIRTSTAPEEAS